MKKRKLLFIFVVLMLAFFFFFSREDNKGLKDNYYQAINREVIEDNLLNDDEYSWSIFTEAQERVDEDTTEIVEQILNNETNYLDDHEIKVIKNIYDKALNMDKRDSDGIKALSPYLNKVWKVSSIDELVDAIIVIEQNLGIDILTSIQVMEDFQNNTKNMIYFIPVTFAFGASSDYIIDEDYMAYKAYLKRACVQLWKAYGRDPKEAREIVSRVFSFYEDIISHSKLSSDLENVASYYQVVTEDDILKIFSNVNREYFFRKGLLGRDIYSIVDQEQYQYLNDSLIMDNLNIWKEVIVTKILSSYASYGSSEYVKIVDDLNTALVGNNEEKSNEEQAIDLIKDLFINEIDEIYVKEVLDNEHESQIRDMVTEIKNVYENRLKDNQWLSKEALDKALLKLDKMEVIIGLDENLAMAGVANKLEVSNSSLIEDVMKVQQLLWKEEIARLDNGKKRELVSQSVVNAYYQPLDNSIVIPVAFLELVGENNSYYENLGTLGMILAHEVTHGFDGNGSQFDENGNLNNWWNEEDEQAFLELQDEVIEYYSQYEVLDGKYIDGKKTVNENIADLGAVACISEIAMDKSASEKELQEMFSAFAGLWASNESEEYMKLLLLQDVHSPNQFRVNGTLSSSELFYQVYDVYPWDKMWISKDKRVQVW